MADPLINSIDGKREVLGICYENNQSGIVLSKIAKNSVGFINLYYGDTVSSGSSFIYKQLILENNKSTIYLMTNLHVVQGMLAYYNITKRIIINKGDLDSINKGISVKIMEREFSISEFIVPKGQYLNPMGIENSHLDFAMFKIDTDIGDAIEIFGTRNDWEISQGEDIFAFGYPRGLELSIKNGIVGAIYEDDKNPEDFMTPTSRQNKWCIEHNVLINPGNSGGPTVNGKGRIVGVSTRGMVTSVAVGVNFSLNMKYIMNFIKEKSNLEVIKVKEFIDFVTRRAKEDTRYGS